MAKYTVHNYHADWVGAKNKAHLSNNLFKKRLGDKLDALNSLYTQAMAADSKKFLGLAKKHRGVAGDVKKIVPVYRDLVAKNGNDRGAISVLDMIYQSGHRTILDQMEDDLRDKGKTFI